jgi:hypothetical protein
MTSGGLSKFFFSKCVQCHYSDLPIIPSPGAQELLPKSHQAATHWIPLFDVVYQAEVTEIMVTSNR